MCCLLILFFKSIKWIGVCFCRCLFTVCPPVRLTWQCVSRINWICCVGFIGGYLLGQMYYEHLLKQIPFPYNIGTVLSLSISFILGIGNAICRQLRCISLLTFPMYCGKPGRGVLKAVVLTYVIAGPITNMGYNAREVVRVFACSTQLSYNLTETKYSLMARPLKKAIFGLKSEVHDVKDSLRYINNVAVPIEKEILDKGELNMSRKLNDYIDYIFMYGRRSDLIEKKYKSKQNDTEQDIHQKMYLKKLEYRCNDQLSQAVAVCMEMFRGAFAACRSAAPRAAAALCWPMRVTYVCNLMHILGGPKVCDSRRQVDPGLGEGFVKLEMAKNEMTKNFKDVKLQFKVNEVRELHDIQDAKETGERVMHAFEEKHLIMRKVIHVVDACVALLFLRIIVAAGTYHDLYLTSIGHDNVYVTGYFKTVDARRMRDRKYTLLPLKKMERSKYIDVHSLAYTAERNKIVTQILKVLLEMVTATTFVMLDRLFYEALDVVRQHADTELAEGAERDLDIQVEGIGLFARLVRSVLSGPGAGAWQQLASHRACLPRPRTMPPAYFVYIYGGYVWILMLLYVNPYTLRLRRLICSWFYPRREKQRILHLYNDILKKRVKMQKTLQRKAVQAIRAHYLSGENLLSLTIKFPQLLGWLRVFPAARMACLICGETEPRNPSSNWHSCITETCPFVYCAECWDEVGRRCLACDASLADLSDVDSLSEDEQPRY